MKPILSFRIKGCFATLILTAIWVFAAPTAVAQQEQASGATETPKGNAQNGKKLYNDIGCWQCHGYSGQGGAAPKIAPNPSSYRSFSNYIRAPKGEMPPYTVKVLPDSNLADIYSFLLTIPKPPDPKDIPLLKEE